VEEVLSLFTDVNVAQVEMILTHQLLDVQQDALL
jgi:hypothetical protein